MGDLALHRVPGDFADELVYVASSGEYTLWVKSRELLAGPWDWVIEESRSPIDLGGPFLTREEATQDLAAALAASGIACPAPPDEIVSVAAASSTPEPARSAVASIPVTTDDDPELIGLALDMAIVALRRARSRLPSARAA